MRSVYTARVRVYMAVNVNCKRFSPFNEREPASVAYLYIYIYECTRLAPSRPAPTNDSAVVLYVYIHGKLRVQNATCGSFPFGRIICAVYIHRVGVFSLVYACEVFQSPLYKVYIQRLFRRHRWRRNGFARVYDGIASCWELRTYIEGEQR